MTRWLSRFSLIVKSRSALEWSFYFYFFSILAFCLKVIISFESGNGLPTPFFYDKSDSFMDFFHTNYWAFNDSRYTDWSAIYPLFAELSVSPTSDKPGPKVTGTTNPSAFVLSRDDVMFVIAREDVVACDEFIVPTVTLPVK